MKRKDAKKFRIRRNNKGYWEKGGGCEMELLVSVVCLVLMVVLLGAVIVPHFVFGV